MSDRLQRTALLVGLLVASLAPRSAAGQAQGGPDVEAEHARGTRLRTEGHDAEAREVYRQLYERTREPRALARQALAEGAMGEWVAAEEHLVAALAAESDRWIRANRSGRNGLEDNLARIRTHLASLEVVCATPGAELWMRNTRVATLPLERPLRVVAGVVAFEVRAPGCVDEPRRETVEAGPTRRFVVELTAVRAAPPAPHAPPPPVAPPSLPGVGAERPPPRRWMRPLAWVSLGVGAVGLGAGLAASLLGADNAGTYARLGCSPARGGVCDELTSENKGVYHPMQIVGFVVGGVAAVAGAVLWVAAPASNGEARAGFRCVASSGGGQCGITF
jgi:hypothetical protein